MIERSTAKALVAHLLPTGQMRLEKLCERAGLQVQAKTADLSEIYSTVEHTSVGTVLIDADLVRRPEAEILIALFNMLSVNYLIFQQDSGPLPRFARNSRIVPYTISPADITSMDTRTAVKPMAASLAAPTVGATKNRIIAIGSSTGGVEALLTILRQFPEDCPPTVVVQHTGGAFSESLARLLNASTAPTVREAVNGDTLKQGQILIAPGSRHHMTLGSGHRIKLVEAPPVSGHRPSVDMLFRSTLPVAHSVTAALLTGMGRDGAEGLLALRNAGATTIGQDQATSVVYGMPRVAAEIGAVGRQLPLSQIARHLIGQPSSLRFSA